MAAFRITFVDSESGETGSRRWGSEAEARAFVAGLWRCGKRFRQLQLFELREKGAPVKLSLKSDPSVASGDASDQRMSSTPA